MTARRWGITGVAAALIVILAAVLWYFFIRDDAPPPLTLDGALTTTTVPGGDGTTTPPTTGDVVATTGTTSPATQAATSTTVAEGSGTWTIDPSGTVVGYRIDEELAGIGGATAVGRTSEVAGDLMLSGAVIEAVRVTVDMTTLESDDSRRDGQLRRRGLETNTFPEASFALTAPIDLGSLPAVGETITVDAAGELTLHGVTRPVQIVLEGQFIDEAAIVVVGSAGVVLADYDIEAPTGLSVLSVADEGVLEFQLTFRR